MSKTQAPQPPLLNTNDCPAQRSPNSEPYPLWKISWKAEKEGTKKKTMTTTIMGWGLRVEGLGFRVLNLKRARGSTFNLRKGLALYIRSCLLPRLHAADVADASCEHIMTVCLTSSRATYGGRVWRPGKMPQPLSHGLRHLPPPEV